MSDISMMIPVYEEAISLQSSTRKKHLSWGTQSVSKSCIKQLSMENISLYGHLFGIEPRDHYSQYQKEIRSITNFPFVSSFPFLSCFWIF